MSKARTEEFHGIKRDETKCTGCGACTLACSWTAGEGRGAVTGVRVDDRVAFSVCRHCARPECLLGCPVGAISLQGDRVVFDAERCLGCGMCAASCPHGGIRFDGSTPSRCDLCGGTPACVALCPNHALEYRGQTSYIAGWREGEDLLSPGLSSCLGCNVELALRFALRTLGRNTILAIPPGCMGGVGVVGFGMTTGAKVPVFFPLLDNIASMLTGIKREYTRKGVDVHAVAFAGDGGTADVGFQCLSAAAERGENIIYICYDNEGYMNTGFQRSGTTPYGAWTSTTPVGRKGVGKKQKSKNMPLIMAAHEVPYVATACMSYPHDFERKLRKAMEVKDGLVYIHLFSPCATGWRFPTDRGVEVGRLAVETNFFPLWEMERGAYRFTVHVKQTKPLEVFLESMGKYAHLSATQKATIKRTAKERYGVLKSLAERTDGK